jgi:hypothetical protein
MDEKNTRKGEWHLHRHCKCIRLEGCADTVIIVEVVKSDP